MFRKYIDNNTVAIQRQIKTYASGTRDPRPTYETLAGMDALEAAFKHLSSTQSMQIFGRASSEGYLMNIDVEMVPEDAEIKEQDRVVVSAGLWAGTYTIIEAKQIEGRWWNCAMEKKNAS